MSMRIGYERLMQRSYMLLAINVYRLPITENEDEDENYAAELRAIGVWLLAVGC